MLLAVDIGNSNIVMACWNEGQWNEPLRLNTHPMLERTQYRTPIRKWLEQQQIEAVAISSVALSSVVPERTDYVVDLLVSLFAVTPLVLNYTIDTGISLGAEHPERVGADLIADAAGAYGRVKDTCIVVDFGTATTIMAVEKPGLLAGVSICAGLKVSVEALVGKAAQLQNIPLNVPSSAIGKNTIQAMQSGLVLGHLCMVEGLIDRMKNEIGPAKVVATGGLVSLLAPHTAHFDHVEPMLTLNGLRIIAKRNNPKA